MHSIHAAPAIHKSEVAKPNQLDSVGGLILNSRVKLNVLRDSVLLSQIRGNYEQEWSGKWENVGSK